MYHDLARTPLSELHKNANAALAVLITVCAGEFAVYILGIGSKPGLQWRARRQAVVSTYGAPNGKKIPKIRERG
jgi:hypothetical protein